MAKRPTQSRDDQPTTTSASTSGPRELPLVALRETVIFPEMIVPLQVGREKSVNALNAAVAEGGPRRLLPGCRGGSAETGRSMTDEFHVSHFTAGSPAPMITTRSTGDH